MKENTTFSIDSEVKKDFKMECIKNDAEMSATVEHLMSNYVSLSQEMHKANEDAKREQ